MIALDEILAQGLMVICCGFQTEGGLCKGMPAFEHVHLETEALETLSVIIKDKPPHEGFAGGYAEESVMAVFGAIDTYHQILSRSANFTLELTEFLESAIIVLHHRNLLVKVIVMVGHHCHIA
jgi:hypothetical protein